MGSCSVLVTSVHLFVHAKGKSGCQEQNEGAFTDPKLWQAFGRIRVSR